MSIKMIKTPEDHQAALKRLEHLMNVDPPVGTPESDELEVLAVLLDKYEAETFPVLLSDPVDAIRFRMDQQALSQKDLIPFLGSASRVSEVLSGKRPLTLAMIRALHEGLGIPAEILVKASEPPAATGNEVDWTRFPLKEMVKRGWIATSFADAKTNAAELVRMFFDPVGGVPAANVLYRRTYQMRSARQVDPYALAAWQARVLLRAQVTEVQTKYEPGSLDEKELYSLVKLSGFEDGPIRARDFLEARGIPLIIEPHLPKTHLDGAVLRSSVNTPVIGLTLRYDRLDNFWFTLAHEVAHAILHFDRVQYDFYDADLESASSDELVEREADQLAGDSLVPEGMWRTAPARYLPSPEAVALLAKQLGVHHAVVAGKVRHESRNFGVLSNLVGVGEVRKLFREVDWSIVEG